MADTAGLRPAGFGLVGSNPTALTNHVQGDNMKIEVIVEKTTMFQFEDHGTPKDDPGDEFGRIYDLLQHHLTNSSEKIDIQVMTQRVISMACGGAPIHDAE